MYCTTVKRMPCFSFLFFNSSFIIAQYHIRNYMHVWNTNKIIIIRNLLCLTLSYFRTDFSLNILKLELAKKKESTKTYKAGLISPLKITFSFIRRTCRDSWLLYSVWDDENNYHDFLQAQFPEVIDLFVNFWT